MKILDQTEIKPSEIEHWMESELPQTLRYHARIAYDRAMTGPRVIVDMEFDASPTAPKEPAKAKDKELGQATLEPFPSTSNTTPGRIEAGLVPRDPAAEKAAGALSSPGLPSPSALMVEPPARKADETPQVQKKRKSSLPKGTAAAPRPVSSDAPNGSSATKRQSSLMGTDPAAILPTSARRQAAETGAQKNTAAALDMLKHAEERRRESGKKRPREDRSDGDTAQARKPPKARHSKDSRPAESSDDDEDADDVVEIRPAKRPVSKTDKQKGKTVAVEKPIKASTSKKAGRRSNDGADVEMTDVFNEPSGLVLLHVVN